MNKFITVLIHTFLTTAKSKTFIITTVLTSLLVGVVFNLPGMITALDKDEIDNVGVVDKTGSIYELIIDQFNDLNVEGVTLTKFENEKQAEEKVNEGEVVGYLVINSMANGTLETDFMAPHINEVSGVVGKLEQALNQIQFRLKADDMGLTVQQASQLFQKVSIEKIPLAEDAKSEEEIVQSIVLVYILLFAIYFGVLMYGNLVAMEIAKEKSSRVMEILISSVNPITQMFGKILGIALLGLVQTIILGSIGYVSMQFGDKSVDLGDMVLDFSNIPASTIVYALVFYLLGYLLFSTLAAMLGSLVSRVEDLQQTITPLNLIIIAAFMIAMFGLNNPNTMLIKVTSFIPFFTPMIMFLRVGVGNPATVEVLISIGLLILTIVGIAILAAKVYRGGVLMYGKGATFKNVAKAITLHKKDS